MPPLLMPGAGPPGGAYFPGAPYGQMYPHFPLQMGGPMGEAHLNGGMGPMLFGPGGTAPSLWLSTAQILQWLTAPCFFEQFVLSSQTGNAPEGISTV